MPGTSTRTVRPHAAPQSRAVIASFGNEVGMIETCINETPAWGARVARVARAMQSAEGEAPLQATGRAVRRSLRHVAQTRATAQVQVPPPAHLSLSRPPSVKVCPLHHLV
eukprot:358065-Chlamydomonas_euryale.AAC.2